VIVLEDLRDTGACIIAIEAGMRNKYITIWKYIFRNEEYLD